MTFPISLIKRQDLARALTWAEGDGNHAAVEAALNELETKRAKTRMSVLDFGAVGDGRDDTAAIQAAINEALSRPNGELYIPSRRPGESFHVSAPLVINGPLRIKGAGPSSAQIMGMGMSAGQHILDFDCLSGSNVEQIYIEGVALRSDNGLPNALRFKNASYVTTKDTLLLNLANGMTIEGVRCFTHSHEQLNTNSISANAVQFAAGFAGGGQFTFIGSTFVGSTGFYIPSTAFLDNPNFRGCNFEQCVVNSFFCGGTVAGLSFSGCRTEGCNSIDFVLRPLLGGEYIGGIAVSGCVFGASDSGGSSRILLGGDAGKVRGFSITGNTVTYGVTDAYAANMVTLNGDGESGVIAGNMIRGTTGGGAGVVNTQRAGVIVFANENMTGKLPEYWGTADWGADQGDWTPTDQSGAALTFTDKGGRYTKVGRRVQWQAMVQYPTTSNTNAADIGGLPFDIGGLTGAIPGRAGAHCDATNAGIAIGVLQGPTGVRRMTLVNPLTLAAITNANLSAKTLYLSGEYTL